MVSVPTLALVLCCRITPTVLATRPFVSQRISPQDFSPSFSAECRTIWIASTSRKIRSSVSPDEHGLSTVTKLSVKRASVGNDGKPRNYPWCVIVENGRAVKEKTATGGTHIKSGTYKKQRSVYVNINDLDFFNLVYRTTRFIESWELTYGPKLIRDARKLLTEQRAAAQQ